ncbi:two-component system response regulator [Burkholderia ubonensis]|uniref:winged helix-turn-helix domain-containing protein n=1 Tax=Burkholderia ubonensis TaxID=101571 RepID=UPI0007531605|nr:response regulator transcription factor [Burkholderia ubonensis]KVO28187.1 two-component system response regulator [Burkholderia ubonensis]KVQ07230.1 two-component system response regulator [Burkholderia ubonensis]KVT92607.1 two-component system response regulator [Burkholderia ubonensis]KVU90747.1 two-component system response regulator [Burkholderia ubonensis]KWE88293.1 two-component system response regulator [Burkholderia ubonensis]
MSEKHRILVLDDDPEVRAWLTGVLEEAGFEVSAVDSAAHMQQRLAAAPHALVILDLKLRGEDGLTVARELRRRSDVSIIMISGLGDETDRVLGLETAADDFVTKPFSGRELLARVRAQLRRTTELSMPRPASNGGGPRFCFDGWTLDLSARTLTHDGSACALTQGEFELLAAMVQQPSRVWSRDQLLEHTRGFGIDVYDRTIDVLILRLRRKIEPNPEQPTYIRTQRGVGYVFAVPVVRV